MLIVRLALRNLSRSRRRTRAIGVLVAMTVAAMTLGNAVLDGTDRGIRQSYIDSFTGDLSVSALSREAFSVFGSQTPIVGSLTRMPTIAGFDGVLKAVQDRPRGRPRRAHVCGIVVMESGSYRKPVSAFGIEGPSYFDFFPACA